MKLASSPVGISLWLLPAAAAPDDSWAELSNQKSTGVWPAVEGSLMSPDMLDMTVPACQWLLSVW